MEAPEATLDPFRTVSLGIWLNTGPTLGPGLRARKKAASCGSGLLGQTLLLEGGSSSTTLPADALGFFGAREVYLCVDLHARGVAL